VYFHYILFFVALEHDCSIIFIKVSRTKNFQMNGYNFGWMAIEDIFTCSRSIFPQS